ncbi:MAG: hypothetical protein ACLQVD_07825 [Capsulimonadaceae bacterium]
MLKRAMIWMDVTVSACCLGAMLSGGVLLFDAGLTAHQWVAEALGAGIALFAFQQIGAWPDKRRLACTCAAEADSSGQTAALARTALDRVLCAIWGRQPSGTTGTASVLTSDGVLAPAMRE